MQHCRKLDFSDAPQLIKVEAFAFAEVAGVVVHRVGDGTSAFEELGGWEAVLVEGLVV